VVNRYVAYAHPKWQVASALQHIPPVADLDSRAGGEFMASAGREPVIVVWGAVPPVGSRGNAW